MLEFVSNKQIKKLRMMRVVTSVKSKGSHAKLLCVTAFSEERCLSFSVTMPHFRKKFNPDSVLFSNMNHKSWWHKLLYYLKKTSWREI